MRSQEMSTLGAFARGVVAGVASTLLILLSVAPAGGAELEANDDLLLQRFEVDFLNLSVTTLFAVWNPTEEAVTVSARVVFNDPTQNFPLVGRTLAPHEVWTANLANISALAERTDAEGFVEGAVYFSAHGAGDIVGDYFVVRPSENYARGDRLVSLRGECRQTCDALTIRFLEGGGFDGGTTLGIWHELGLHGGDILIRAYAEDGTSLGERLLEDWPVTDDLNLADLDFGEPFGTLVLSFDASDARVSADYSALGRFSVGLYGWCLPQAPRPPPACVNVSVSITEILVNGVPRDGCLVDEPCVIRYQVFGTRPSVDVEVLAGLTWTPNGSTGVISGTPRTTGLVTIQASNGCPSQDAVRIPVDEMIPPPPPPPPNTPAIRLEKLTDGHDADTAPGPTMTVSDGVQWSYVVTNVGDVALHTVTVIDDREGLVGCPADLTLEPGESFTCFAKGIAQEGQYRNVAEACGAAESGEQVCAEDPSHYFGELPPPPEAPVCSLSVHPDTIELGQSTTVSWKHEGCEGQGTLVVETETAGASGDVPLIGSDVFFPTEWTKYTFSCSGPGGSVSCPGSVTVIEPPPPPPVCGCDGKVSWLSLKRREGGSSQVKVKAKHGSSTVTVFSGTVAVGDSFTLTGPSSSNPGFSGTLGTEIKLYVDGRYHATIHTSCSTPVGPNLVAGDFMVTGGSSKNLDAPLCPLPPPPPTCDESNPPSYTATGTVTHINSGNGVDVEATATVTNGRYEIQLMAGDGGQTWVKDEKTVRVDCEDGTKRVNLDYRCASCHANSDFWVRINPLDGGVLPTKDFPLN